MSFNTALNVLLAGLDGVELFSEHSPAAQVVVAKAKEKSLRVNWPHDVNEVHFDFLIQGSEQFSDWVDFYNGEERDEIGAYIAAVATYFFTYPVRVDRRGHLLKHTQIEYVKDDQWHPLLSVEPDMTPNHPLQRTPASGRR